MRAFEAEINTTEDLTRDAVFEAGLLHGCEDCLLILWHNFDSTEPSWEWVYIHKELVKNAWARSDTFREFMEDIRTSAPGYWRGSTYDFDTDSFDELDDFADAYTKADFINGIDGDDATEAMFILNWAKEV